MSGIVELKGVHKEYPLGKLVVHALRGVDLSIGKGEFTAVAGPSGSGKTTLLNLVGCVDVPTQGEVWVAGQSTASLSDRALTDLRLHRIGFIFQTYNLLPRLSALANVELPLLYGNSADKRSRSLEALNRVGLADRVHHRPVELSGGQQQRVGIARALVKNPSILLADEPTGNLDSRSSDEVIAILQGLNQEEGLTVITVTHDPEVADCNRRVISMGDGLVSTDQAIIDQQHSLGARN